MRAYQDCISASGFIPNWIKTEHAGITITITGMHEFHATGMSLILEV